MITLACSAGKTWLPVLLIDLVSKAHCVHNGQLEVDVALLQVVGPWPQVDAILVVAGLLVLKHGVEERVHQCGLADARLPWIRMEGGSFRCNVLQWPAGITQLLTYTQDVEAEALRDRLADQLVGEAVEAHMATKTQAAFLLVLKEEGGKRKHEKVDGWEKEEEEKEEERGRSKRRSRVGMEGAGRGEEQTDGGDIRLTWKQLHILL